MCSSVSLSLPVYFSGPATNHQRVKENVFLPFSLQTLFFLQSLVNTAGGSEGGFTLLSCGSWPEHGYSRGCLKICGPGQVISPLQYSSHLLRGLIIFTWQGGMWIKLDTTLRKIKPPHKTWAVTLVTNRILSGGQFTLNWVWSEATVRRRPPEPPAPRGSVRPQLWPFT